MLETFYRFLFQSGLRRTFALFMLIATLLPISIGGVTSYMISKQTIQEQVSEFNVAWIEKQLDYMELILQEIGSLMDNIANIDSIKNAVDEEASTKDNYTNLSTQATIGYILSGYNIKGLVSIDLLSLSDTHYHVGDTLNFQTINAETRDKLIRMALDSPDSIVWAGLEDNINVNSTNQKVITAVKLIKKISPETLQEVPVGILIVNYSLDSFYQHFAQGSLDATSTLMIIEKDRDILFNTDRTKIGAKAALDFAQKLTGANGTFIDYVDSREMFVVYSNSSLYGWSVLSYVPVNNLTENAKPIIGYTFAVALLCLFLIAVYALNLSRKVLVPINEMTVLFKEIGEDHADLTRRLAVSSSDEIGELARWFNAFLENLSEKKLIEDQLKQAYEELEIRVKERTSELVSLNTALNDRTREIQDTLEKLKATQNQLIQREKLAGIGQLAAGIAHEINNPLGFVSSNMSSLEGYLVIFKKVLLMYQALGEQLGNHPDQTAIEKQLAEIVQYESSQSMNYIINDLDELLQDVNTGLERVGKIVKNLRTFAWMDKEAVFEEYDLNLGIENSLMIAQNEVKYVATVELSLGAIPRIMAIGNEVNQVLLNIIVNAAHAIKEKASDSLGLIKISTVEEQDYVRCIIEDNGIGIPEGQLNQIFNPFFTTKAVGEGTGLGLNISYDIIVNQHHGEILTESAEGAGTTFTIRLPIRQIEITDGLRTV